MKGKEKYPVSIYEYRCRRCKEIFTMTIEDNFGDLVGMMLNLNKSDKEIEEELAIFNEEKKEDEELLTEKADLFEIHLCEDGGRGLGDLIGCEPAREVTIYKGTWRGHYRDRVNSNFTGRQKEPLYQGW
jgi:hypothetical protein